MFYKFLRSDMTHYGFNYKLGLNIDFKHFTPFGECQPGGLYYTTKEHLIKFSHIGDYLAEIEIPEDAQTYDEGKGKWKADKLVIKKIYLFSEFEGWNEHDFCMNAVRTYGDMLYFVKNQTEDICLESVKQDSNNLRFVKNQTEKIRKAAKKRKRLD